MTKRFKTERESDKETEGVSVHIYRAVETEGVFVCDSVFAR
jgi:hypothetical protein